MNLSLNETLSRTIMTSMTTLIALVVAVFPRRRRGQRLRPGDDRRRGDRHLFLDLRRQRDRAVAGGQARLVEGQRQRRPAPSSATSRPDAAGRAISDPGRSRERRDANGPGQLRRPAAGRRLRPRRLPGGRHRAPRAAGAAAGRAAGRGPGCPTWRRSWNDRRLRRAAGGHGRGDGGRCRAGSARCGRGWRRRASGSRSWRTPSACRTYNVLLAEGRRIAAALMPV